MPLSELLLYAFNANIDDRPVDPRTIESLITRNGRLTANHPPTIDLVKLLPRYQDISKDTKEAIESDCKDVNALLEQEGIQQLSADLQDNMETDYFDEVQLLKILASTLLSLSIDLSGRLDAVEKRLE